MLDDFDYRILKILSENSRLSYAEIGRKISLSQSATKERVQNLVENGIIKHFTVEVDYEKLGYPLKVVISLKLKMTNSAGLLMMCINFRKLSAAKG